MTKTYIHFATLLAVLALTACSPAANDPNTDTQIKVSASSALPQTHANLFQIIRSGDNAKSASDANAMADAARALTQIGAKPLGDHTPDLAKEWKQAALALEPNLQDLPFRGRVKGPAYRKKTLAAGATEVLQEIYYASEKAKLSLQTLSGQTIEGHNLELSIIEQTESGDGEAVCTLSLHAEPATCQWLPLWTAKYNITITNHSQSPVPYLLVTN